MQPRDIKVVQRCRATGKTRTAELCWRYLVLIAERCQNKTPAAILDAMLWGGEVETDRFAYRIEH